MRASESILLHVRIRGQAAKVDGKEPKKKADGASSKGSYISHPSRSRGSKKRKPVSSHPPPTTTIAKKRGSAETQRGRVKAAGASKGDAVPVPPAAAHVESLNKGNREGGYSSRAAALVGRAAAGAASAVPCTDRISAKSKTQPAARATIRTMFQHVRIP